MDARCAQLLAPFAAELAPRLHRTLGGSRIDLAGLALAAALSWVGITGPGEAALIAASLAAAHGRVDIVDTILVAWLGAMAGGTAGWVIGLKGGRALMARPGPLHATRLRLLRHGDDVYARRGWLAVYLAPSWMAGVSAMPARRFLPANAIASLAWALAIGMGTFVAGPPIAEAFGDVGLIGLAVAAVVVVASALLAGRRRRLR
jgi:membrane protein DedA with SNARE-associated domain